MRRKKKEYRFPGFSETFVIVKGSCNIFYENDSVYTPLFSLNATRIFVPTTKKWALSEIVRVQIRILNEVTIYEGRAIVEAHNTCCFDLLGQGITLRFLGLHTVVRGFRGRYRQIRRAHDMLADSALDTIRYALAEAGGNTVVREFGEPYAGFKQPVVLIQGWLGTRGIFRIFENRLKADGFQVLSFNLGRFNVQDIKKSAEIIAKKISNLRDHHHLEKIDIVGHSMGGLIGLYALKRLGVSDSVNRLITVGTPYHGTNIAYAGLPFFGLTGKGLWQLLPDSKFLQALHEGRLPDGTEVISIMSRHDFLAPGQTAVLEGAINLLVSAGHASLAVNDEVYKVLRAVLHGRQPFLEEMGYG